MKVPDMTPTNLCEHDWTTPTKFKDVIITDEGFPYTVYIRYCRKCGEISGEGTWVE